MLAAWQQSSLDLADKEAARHSQVRMSEIPEWQMFWEHDPPLKDSFLRELIASAPVQRLRQIGFLGAIDYLVHGNGSEPHRRRHNRFDHSVNVALLALRYAMLRNLSEAQTRTLTAAALLHDVGHGPLSHTLEPAFRQLFQIDHHQAGKAIVSGESPLGGEIPQVFRRHKVNIDEVLSLLAGTDRGPHAFLFDSPMNFDTIEAIARCCLLSKSPQAIPPTEFVDAIATRDEFPIDFGDRFWSVKETIYKTVIGSRSGIAADSLAQQYMLAMAARFQTEDFYLHDAQLRKKHPDLFVIFETLRNPVLRQDCRVDALVTFNFDCVIEAQARRFTVNSCTQVKSPADLAVRYTQSKTRHALTLRSLVFLGAGCSRQQLFDDSEWWSLPRY